MNRWRALLLPFSELKVSLPGDGWRRRKCHHVLSKTELADAVTSFRALPVLVDELSEGHAQMTAEIRDPERVLSSLTHEQGDFYWPSPDDVQPELNRFVRDGSYDSVFVLWPQHDEQSGSQIRCRGWGLGMVQPAD